MNRYEEPSRVFVEQQRGQIPQSLLAVFEDTTNAGLLSMEKDDHLPPQARMHARSELNYREFYGILVDFHPVTYSLRRQQFTSIAEAEASERADDEAKRSRRIHNENPSTAAILRKRRT